MSWALVLLSRHPEARARVLREIREALGPARVTAKALKAMPYTQVPPRARRLQSCVSSPVKLEGFWRRCARGL